MFLQCTSDTKSLVKNLPPWHSAPMLLKVQSLQQWAMGPTLGAWGPRAEKKEEALHRLSYKGNDRFPSQPVVQVSRFSLL